MTNITFLDEISIISDKVRRHTMLVPDVSVTYTVEPAYVVPLTDFATHSTVEYLNILYRADGLVDMEFRGRIP